jgi:8-hydroxy-5-deazaflavin:NADPH oxidoreductase
MHAAARHYIFTDVSNDNDLGAIGMKQTLAIVGAAGALGSELARKFAKAGHRVILAGHTQSSLDGLHSIIGTLPPEADVDILDCAREASWEADIVILAVPHEIRTEVVEKIGGVVTGKIVVSLVGTLNRGLMPAANGAEECATLLPHSMLVKVLADDFNVSNADGKSVDCWIVGDDDDSVATVAELVSEAGFRPLVVGGYSSGTLESTTF